MGCVHWHNGVAIGENSFNIRGLIEPYETNDMGRYEVTGDEIDKKVWLYMNFSGYDIIK